jgi:hypothetical protein
MIKLGELLIDDEAALALRAWLDELVEQQRRNQAKVEADEAENALNDQRYDKLIAIAREWATKHGPIEWMDTYAQAEAAYTSWEQGAGHLDVDEYFQLDSEWRESWITAYVSQVEGMRGR